MTPDLDCVWQHPPAIVRKAPRIASPASAPKPKKRKKLLAPVFVGCEEELPTPPLVLIPPPEIVVEEEGGFSPMPDLPPVWPVEAPPETFAEGCECGGPNYGVPETRNGYGGGGYSSTPVPVVYRLAPIPEPGVWALLLAGLGLFSLRRKA